MKHAEVVPVAASSSSYPRTPGPTPPPEQLLAATPAAVHLLTIEQVAQRCHVSTKTVRRAIDRGELRASQLATRGAWVVRSGDFEAWLDRRANRPPRSPNDPVSAPAPIRYPAEGRPAQRSGPSPGGRLVITREMGR